MKSDNSTAFSPTIWRKRGPDGDYTWEVERVSNAKLEHLTVVSCVRTCFKTTRVTGLRMGGFEPARWRENFCCVTPKRVAGVGFATFMEHTCPSRVPEDHCFLLDSPFRSRIGRKMMRFWLLCDGLCLECWRNIYFFASSRFLVLRRLFLSSFSLHRYSRPRSPLCAVFSGAAAAAAGRVSLCNSTFSSGLAGLGFLINVSGEIAFLGRGSRRRLRRWRWWR